jgi:hypothetical protein
VTFLLSIFRISFAMLAACALVACGGRPDMAEIVLCTGSKVAVRGTGSSLTVGATSLTTRSYVVDDFDLVIELIPRIQRWNGNLGLYRPSGKGDTHAVLEEGQQFFANEEDLYQWIDWARRWGGELRYTSDGLLMHWSMRHRGANEAGPKRSLNVDIVQLMLKGQKPQGCRARTMTLSRLPMARAAASSAPRCIVCRKRSGDDRWARIPGWARDVMQAHGITAEQVENRIAHGRASVIRASTYSRASVGEEDWRQSYVVQVTAPARSSRFLLSACRAVRRPRLRRRRARRRIPRNREPLCRAKD